MQKKLTIFTPPMFYSPCREKNEKKPLLSPKFPISINVNAIHLLVQDVMLDVSFPSPDPSHPVTLMFAWLGFLDGLCGLPSSLAWTLRSASFLVISYLLLIHSSLPMV